MPIYDKPTKTLMREFAAEKLSPGQIFKKQDAVAWFGSKYPKIKPATVRMHVDVMSINSSFRKHHLTIKPGSGHDLFLKLSPSQFRLWDQSRDIAPQYGSKSDQADQLAVDDDEHQDDGVEESRGAQEFAFEADLRNYIARNLHVIEPGLKLYEEEDVQGIEFPVDGRRIDVLCLDAQESFVVIELKVSRGYDRTIGQLMRYMGWVQQNLAGDRPVRGVIVAANISQDLKIAASLLPRVSLIEYQISFSLKRV